MRVKEIDLEELEKLLKEHGRDPKWAHTKGYYNKLKNSEVYDSVEALDLLCKLKKNLEQKMYRLSDKTVRELLSKME